MKRAWIGAVLNFFFPGAGYLVVGHSVLPSLAYLVGCLGLTYVELGIKEAAPSYYWPMFIAVFVMNIGFAIDAFRLGKAKAEKEAGAPAAAPSPA